MNTPVDLANLRSMTDGDTDMEKALFEEFFSSFEAGIGSLQANIRGTLCAKHGGKNRIHLRAWR